MNDPVGTADSGGEFKPVRVAVVGVGGHGVVMCSRLIAETAVSVGIHVSMSEVHGMAQRGGVVETTIVLGMGNCAMIGKGSADLLLATEPLEALRAHSLAGPGASIVVWMVANPPASAVPRPDGPVYPGRAEIVAGLGRGGCRVWALDCDSRPGPGGSIRANTALLGAAVRTGVLPFGFDDIAAAIRNRLPADKVESNLVSMEFGRDRSVLLSEFLEGDNR